MQQLFVDFETYYDDDYSLRKMTPIEYVNDPRFEALGCAFSTADGRSWWVDGPDIPAELAKHDWSKLMATAHNSLFDMLVMAVRYKVFPAFYGDTMSMARNWIVHHTGRVSLAACSAYYDLGGKMDTLSRTKGVNFQALKANWPLHAEVIAYGLDDVTKCRKMFGKMLEEGFPINQLEIIDLVVRMVTQPSIQLDMTVLAEHLAATKAEKQALLDAASLDNPDSLMSDNQLAAKLLFLGVDVPMKESKRTGKTQYAFAKTDKAFTALLEHDEPMVQALVAARLGHKSTIEETRTERLLSIGRVSPMLPVPLKYSGAHTHRFSGEWLINLQNLGRKSRLRKALKAPKGKVIVAVDASQIEARFNAELSGQEDLCDMFRRGEDVYASFAEDIYHYKVNKHEHPTQRFVGKTGILSLGYGSSAPVFQAMCRNQGNVILTDQEAVQIVYTYRQRFAKIVQNWRFADKTILPNIAGDMSTLLAERLGAMKWGPLVIEKNRVILPSGNMLRYRDLRQEFTTNPNTGVGGYNWVYMRGPMFNKIYGAKLVENVIQALAFVHIMEVAIRVKQMTGGLLWPAHQVHDELLYVVDEGLADQVRTLVVAEMSKSPSWMPNAPLAAEGHIGVTYGDTK